MRKRPWFILILNLLAGLGLVYPCSAGRIPSPLPGQSTTLLPDGRILLIGGEGASGPLSAATVLNTESGTVSPMPVGLHQARAWHTATLLPNGTVLVFGGLGVTGQVVDVVEIFDPTTDTSFEIRPVTLEPRVYHTATLLTDGRVLIAGGRSRAGRILDSIALWDYRSNSGSGQAAALLFARERHASTLLPDGTVLLWGGIDAAGMNLDFGERFDPVVEHSVLQRWPAAMAGEEALPLELEASLPPDGTGDVLADTVVAFRFSMPLSVATANTKTLALAGPEGPLPAKVVPAEGGMLVFVTPQNALLPATTYTVSMSGLAAGKRVLPDTTLSFTTAGPGVMDAGVGTTSDPEGDTDGIITSAWSSLPAYQAAAGVTAVSGQVLRLNGLPLPNVTFKIAGQSATSDESGRFLLSAVPAGHQVMLIDGGTASTPSVTYGVFEVGVEVVTGATNTLPYKIWMPALDTAHVATLPSPTKTETVITSPLLPGLELHLPPSTVVYDHNWNVVTQVGITPIPTDRPPFPLPQGVAVPIYFTIQPGDGWLQVQDPKQPQGGWLVYPNTFHSRPGTRYNFWNYDAEGKGWYVYGHGTVTTDGKQVVPDPGVLIYQLTGAMVGAPGLAPTDGPAPGDLNGGAGDPVDLGTGLFVLNHTDLYLPDIIPIVLARTYRQNDSTSRAFGIGATQFYDMFLVGDSTNFSYTDLILPNGGRIHYKRISPGTDYISAVFHHTFTPTIFYGSTITFSSGSTLNWNLALKDGTVLVFGAATNASLGQVALQAIIDRYGNVLQLNRDSLFNLTSITSPNGRSVQLTYDGSNRVTQATDNAGRTLTYSYDSSGRLSAVKDPNGGLTSYTYDNLDDLLSLTDARGMVYLQNTYDSHQRVASQKLASGGTYKFAYTLNSSGSVTETQVTNPLGILRNVTFNSAGYTSTDVRAVGKPEQQTTTFAWQANTNLLLGFTDALNRTTDFAYDSSGDVTRITRLAGTSAASATSFTYDSQFHRITSITDPLNHVRTFSHDSAGNLVNDVDALGEKWTASYDGAGQPLSITDPLGDTVTLAYFAGDLVGYTDPLKHTFTRSLNGVGLSLRATDALGNTTQFSYDSLDQPTKTVDALGQVRTFAYDPDGNVLSITDARNHVNSYAYDKMDRLVSRTDPLSRKESYQYDLFGNLTQFTDRRGTITRLTYDGLNRVISKTFLQGGTTTSATAFTYDAGNRLTKVADSRSGTIQRTYDGLNDVTSETTPQGTLTYTYDSAKRRTSMTVTGQSTIKYTYDNNNRLTHITQGSATVALAYDARGRRVSLTLPNGVRCSYTYDQASRLTALAYTNGGGTSIGNLVYSYDPDNRRTSLGGTLAHPVLPTAVASATYDAANELTKWGAMNLTYDANGDLLGDGTASYTWNDRNQLVRTALLNVTSATFQYDGFGRRIVLSTGVPTTSYVYDGVNIAQQHSATTNNLLTGLGPDEIFIRTDTSGTSSFLTDGLGSTVALADSSGTIQTTYSYAPFGATSVSGEASTNPFQFTGRENDGAGTGVYYYRARYYYPGYSRFISEDPLRFAGGGALDLRLSENPSSNGYAYASNSPTNLRDFSGLSPNDSWYGALAAAIPLPISPLASTTSEAAASVAAPVDALGATLPVVPTTIAGTTSGWGSNIAGLGLNYSQFAGYGGLPGGAAAGEGTAASLGEPFAYFGLGALATVGTVAVYGAAGYGLYQTYCAFGGC